MNLALDEFDFSPLFSIKDPQIASDYMIDTLFDLYNLYCQLKTVKLSNKDPLYMSPLVKLLLKKTQQLMRRHKHRDADLVSSQISALLVSNIASDKKAKGSAKWWKKVNTLSGWKQKEVLRIPFSAEEMNKYFCSISTVTNYQDHVFLDCTSSELPQLELHQVYIYLKRVKITAAGHDDLPHWFIRENAHNLAEPLHHLYNLCIRYQIFPNVFNLSKVVPITKSKVITQCNMLRPISVNPILARIFERLVYDQFVSNSYNLWLNKNQFGFRNKSLTICALIKLMDDCKSLEKQGCAYIRIFSLDLSKAFDRVPHHLIISQLSKVVPSVNPYIVNLIRSFLMHRKQFVVYDNPR